jgi:hypothetical protein
MSNRCAAVLSTALAALGCGGNSFDISMGTLSGKVGGQPWTLASGETDALQSAGQTTFFTNMYAVAVTPCSNGFDFASNYMILNIPMTPGDYSLSLSLNQTFVVVSGSNTNNLIATSGRIVVDQVTATSVTGGAHFQYDANNTVNGQFTATVCAP